LAWRPQWKRPAAGDRFEDVLTARLRGVASSRRVGTALFAAFFPGPADCDSAHLHYRGGSRMDAAIAEPAFETEALMTPELLAGQVQPRRQHIHTRSSARCRAAPRLKSGAAFRQH
jgi:hypothetical protein